MQIEHFINQIDLTLDPPAEEPLRQYYFIAKARTLVAQMEKEAGRKMTFCVNTFGCQMNARDSEKLCGILNAIGYQESESEDADFVIYNTCTVRENANNKVYGRLGYLHGYKKKNPHMMIALCGCMMQEPEEQSPVTGQVCCIVCTPDGHLPKDLKWKCWITWMVRKQALSLLHSRCTERMPMVI